MTRIVTGTQYKKVDKPGTTYTKEWLSIWKEADNKYICLPESFYADNRLTGEEKNLFAVLVRLCNGRCCKDAKTEKLHFYCNYQNGDIGGIIGKSTSTIQRLLKNLSKKKFISLHYNYDIRGKNKVFKGRTITLYTMSELYNSSENLFKDPIAELPCPHSRTDTTPIAETLDILKHTNQKNKKIINNAEDRIETIFSEKEEREKKEFIPVSINNVIKKNAAQPPAENAENPDKNTAAEENEKVKGSSYNSENDKEKKTKDLLDEERGDGTSGKKQTKKDFTPEVSYSEKNKEVDRCVHKVFVMLKKEDVKYTDKEVEGFTHQLLQFVEPDTYGGDIMFRLHHTTTQGIDSEYKAELCEEVEKAIKVGTFFDMVEKAFQSYLLYYVEMKGRKDKNFGISNFFFRRANNQTYSPFLLNRARSFENSASHLGWLDAENYFRQCSGTVQKVGEEISEKIMALGKGNTKDRGQQKLRFWKYVVQIDEMANGRVDKYGAQKDGDTSEWLFGICHYVAEQFPHDELKVGHFNPNGKFFSAFKRWFLKED